MKILAGVHEPTAGEIVLDGQPQILAPPANAQRHGIETVYQDLALIGTFTAADNFFLGREIAWGRGPALTRFVRRRAMAEMAIGALEELHIDIPKVRTQPVDRMSGGQRQLTAIARGAFWGLIHDLSKTGHTIFVSTHYMDEAEYCHRLALMYRGKIIALGPPAELKKSLTAHSLFQLDSSDLLATMRALEAVAGVADVAVFGSGLHVAVDQPEAAVERIRQALAGKGIEIRRLERIEPSMEDVFVAMIEAEERKAA